MKRKQDMNINLEAIFNTAVRKAVDENKRMGLPNVFCVNGTEVFQLPNGDVVMHYDFSKHEIRKSYSCTRCLI
jgi:hypothetical protein